MNAFKVISPDNPDRILKIKMP